MTKDAENFTAYDPADYLTDLDAAAAYLEAAVDEAGDDPAFIAQALGVIARSGNISELARRIGMSREGLYKALRRWESELRHDHEGRTRPRTATALRIRRLTLPLMLNETTVQRRNVPLTRWPE